MAKLTATWNSQLQVWITDQTNQLLERWVLWQAAWPTSGMTADGKLLEQAISVRHIDANESSYLPTPTAIQSRNATSGRQPGSKHHAGWTLHDLVYVGDLLPTPAARDVKDGTKARERDGVIQTDTIARAILNGDDIQLMGTPRVSSANGSTASQVAADASKRRIEDQVLTTTWGKFDAAIKRWESLTRPAPPPTKPDGRDGNHRLSSEFTEWMMGLPQGWITGQGLKRKDELKMAGNGVCPQQAEYAIRNLLAELKQDQKDNQC